VDLLGSFFHSFSAVLFWMVVPFCAFFSLVDAVF